MGPRVRRTDEKVLYALSGARCALCQDIVIEKKNDGEWYLLGQIHHIRGRNPDALFPDVILEKELHEESNLIVLCPSCHVKIHKSGDFTIEKVIQIKEEHEKRVLSKWGSEISPENLVGSLTLEETKRNEIKILLTTLDVATDAHDSIEPTYFRYPYPKWVDFENHIFHRKEMGMIKEDLQKKSVSLLVGKPGSGKTVLLQMIGYELVNEFDFVYYEDFSRPSDRLLNWHHNTEYGDEYRITACLEEISNLILKSGSVSRVLVILDNTHAYSNFTRHLPELIPSRLPEGISLLLAMRPRYSAIHDEIGELERKSQEGVVELKQIDATTTDKFPFGRLPSHGFTSMYDEDGHIRFVEADRVSLIKTNDSIPCRVVTDERTIEVVFDILNEIGLKFTNEIASEGWIRVRIGASLSLLAVFVLGMTESNGLITLDEQYFCDNVVKRFQVLEDSLIDQKATADYSEGNLRIVFQSLLKTLAWFTHLGIPVPEEYIIDQRRGYLEGIDKRSILLARTYLLDRREIVKGRVGNQITYTLPHDSMGTVVLQCLMGVDFSGLTKHEDVQVLTQMALDLEGYLNSGEKMRLMNGLIFNSIIEVLIEPSILCEFLGTGGKLAWLFLNTLILPEFFEHCKALVNIPRLSEDIINMLKRETIPISLDLLYSNLANANLIHVMLNDDFIKHIITKIEEGETTTILLQGFPEKTVLWYHPRVQDAIIRRTRDIILSADGAITLQFGLLDSPEICQDSRIIEAIQGSINKILFRIRNWSHAWGTLAEFRNFDDIIGNKEVIEAVLSKKELISVIDIETIEKIIKHDGYLKDNHFQNALIPFLESAPITDLAIILRHDVLWSTPKIQKLIDKIVAKSDEPWKLFQGLESCQRLLETKWGQETVSQTSQRLGKYIREIQPPFIELSSSYGTDCLCSDDTLTKEMKLKSEEIASFLLESDESVLKTILILLNLGMLPSPFRTEILEEAVQKKSELILKGCSNFLQVPGISPLYILLAFPKLAEEEHWLKFIISRFQGIGPIIEDLYVITKIPSLKKNKTIRKLIKKRTDFIVNEFYRTSSKREVVLYICHQFPSLKKKKSVKKALKNLGLY